MAKIRNTHRFGTAPNTLLNDVEISLKAKGLYAYMDSKPETWDFTIKGIVSQLKESFDAVRSAITELETSGYLAREQFKDEKGQWDCDYELYPDPTLNPKRGKPYRENPHTVKSVSGKPLHISNKEISKKEEVSLSHIEPAQKIQNEDWKSEILNHPLFEKSQAQYFSNLDQNEIEYTLDLYQTTLKGRPALFSQCISWLKNASLDKIKSEKIKAVSTPKPYENNTYSQNNHKDQSVNVALHPKHIWQEETESDEEFNERCDIEASKGTHRIERHYNQTQQITHNPNAWKKMKAKLFKGIV